LATKGQGFWLLKVKGLGYRRSKFKGNEGQSFGLLKVKLLGY